MKERVCNCSLHEGQLKKAWGAELVAQALYPSTWEAEAEGPLGLRPVWATQWVPGQPGVH